MTIFMKTTARILMSASCVACLATAAIAQSTSDLTTEEDVRSEVSEAMAAVSTYAEQERDAALTQAREALAQLDTVIEAREQELREGWADMSDEAQEVAQARMKDLRDARNMLGERVGALEAGSAAAWTELTDGFSNAWDAFAETWQNADPDESSG